MLRLNLQFFEVTAQIECESEALQAALAQLYRPACKVQPGSPLVRYRIGPGVGVVQFVNGQARRLAWGGVSSWLAQALLFSSLTAQVRTHWLLHAAALRGPKGGLLLAGPSGSGKTTLALALAQRGYGWLSDEVAAVERTRGNLVPFPRGALVRPGTLRLLPNLRSQIELWPLREDDVVGCWHPPKPATSVPLRYVFLLSPAAEKGPTQVAVNCLPPTLAAKLADEPGLAGVEVTLRRGCVILTWPRPLPPPALARLAQECGKSGVLLLNVRPAPAEVDFSAPPRVVPCPASSVWLRLAEAAWNRPSLPFLTDGQDEQEEVMRFLWELAAMLRTVQGYQLHPGPLEDSVALIEQVCGRAGVS